MLDIICVKRYNIHVFCNGDETIMSNKKTKKGLYIIPIALILGILPLIAHLKHYETGLETYGTFAYSEYWDVFLYYKSMLFIILATVMVVLIIVSAIIRHDTIKGEKLFIPLGVYALLSFLSAVFSEYSNYSFKGIFEQFESVWVLLGYAIVVYYCYLFISETKHVSTLMLVLSICTVIMLLIGLSQAFSQDFFRSKIGTKLLLPLSMWGNDDANLQFNFPLGRVYLTLYNPNYVGSYVALLSPIFLMLIFAVKKLWCSIICGVIYVGLLLCIMGSSSRAGFIAIGLSLLLLAVIFNKKLVRFLPEVIIVVVLIVGVVYTFNNYSNNQLSARIKSAFDIQKSEYTLKSIETNDDNFIINYNDNSLKFTHRYSEADDNYSIILTDENNESVSYSWDGNLFTTEDERFKKISFFMTRLGEAPIFIVTIDGKEWDFAYIYESYYYYNSAGNWVKMNNAEHIDSMDEYGKTLNGRLYMWSRTLPLLKDNILLGTGPDTFILAFPNDDYVAKYNAGFENEYITKPHNMYLQIGVQTGILSLICFLVFYFWYFAVSIKLYRKANKSEYLVKIGIGILCGTFGYMVVGLINDSMVVTAPLFWTLLGVGLACNSMIKKSLVSTDGIDNAIKNIEEANKADAEKTNA